MAFDSAPANRDPYRKREWTIFAAEEMADVYYELDMAMMKAARTAIMDTALEWKAVLRSAVVTAGLARSGAGSGRGTGSSLASAIRFEWYPRDLATKLSPSPAAFLYIKPDAVKIFRAFDQGVTITPRLGKYLAIPIPGSPADRQNFGRQKLGSFRVASDNGTSAVTGVLGFMKSKGLQIIVVPARGERPAMLVAVSARTRTSKSGRLKISAAARTAKGGFGAGAQSVPLFFLIPKARMPKKLDLAWHLDGAGRSFQRDYQEKFQAEMEWATRQRQKRGKKTRGAWEPYRPSRRY